MLEVQSKLCSSCIYRSDSPLDLQKLEADVADPKMAGFFKGYRVCHHAPDRRKVCCRGFWDRHRDKFTVGQLAQRLNLVKFVNIDRFKKGKTRAKERKNLPAR